MKTGSISVSGEINNGMALIRPPGHHSMKNDINGFCGYNNVVLVAKAALSRGLKKILIVDFDVHHGQGIQFAFYDDPRVLYISVHRYQHGSFWPNLRCGNSDAIGEGEGRGFNVNIPLNDIGCGDADYMAIWHHLVLPISSEFNPELVLVSAGFDAALGCPEGEMTVTPACYSHLVSPLMSLAKVICIFGN